MYFHYSNDAKQSTKTDKMTNLRKKNIFISLKITKFAA